MIILGIETSCDETACAIFDSKINKFYEIINTQINIHEKFGGTVPEIASRDHIKKISTLFLNVLKKTKINIKNIDCVSYTLGPGLIGSLLVGASFAKSLAYSINKHSIGVNHLEGHILINDFYKKIKYPSICIIASGAHTMLIKIYKFRNYEIIGETIDDGIGETFDKVSRSLDLGYPGGPSIEKFSNFGSNDKNISLKMYNNYKDYNFSFSGVKTQISKLITKNMSNEYKFNIAKSFQDKITNYIVFKCKKSLLENKINNLILAGGVCANKSLREKLLKLENDFGINVFIPPIYHCTDNAAMIAYTGFIKAKENIFDKDLSINVYPKIGLKII